jgi:hypothetical protein
MGLFGRKKKEADVVEEAQDDNQLNLAYGNDDDCSTEGDSLPPPPPGAGSTKQNLSLNDSHTVEDSPSADEANDIGVSMLSDPDSSMDEKNKDQDSSRRKKMMLIFASIATFCILLGLAIKLGLDSKELKSLSSANASELDGTDAGAANDGSSFDSPIAGGDAEEDIFTTSDTIPPVEDIPEEDIPEEDIFTTSNTIPPVEDTTAIEPEVDTTPISTVGESTQVPTIDSSADVTDAATTDVTGVVTGGVTDAGTGDDDLTDDFVATECAVDEIIASSSCDNGVPSASIRMCIADETSDQFWAWIETPEAYAPFQVRDWGWVRDGTDREISGLPEGNYVLGLYSNGDEFMDEYPLIASSEFTILCALN